MKLRLSTEWVQNNPRYNNVSGKFDKASSTFRSSRNIYINDRFVGGVGRRYKNLKPYFEGCDKAIRKYNNAMVHLRIYQVSMFASIGCGVGGLIKVANPKTDKDEKTGNAILIAGAALILNTLVQDGLEKISIKKAVRAYNKCQQPKF
jgi:hypothetical protein